MYAHHQRLDLDEVQELRREGGRFLRELREARGLSQRQLAGLIGADYYTFISQLEAGRGRIPPDRYRVWAEALRVDARDFVQTLMRFYDPMTHDVLFGEDPVRTAGAPRPSLQRYHFNLVCGDAVIEDPVGVEAGSLDEVQDEILAAIDELRSERELDADAGQWCIEIRNASGHLMQAIGLA